VFWFWGAREAKGKGKPKGKKRSKAAAEVRSEEGRREEFFSLSLSLGSHSSWERSSFRSSLVVFGALKRGREGGGEE
jgi:hypothetical protein